MRKLLLIISTALLLFVTGQSKGQTVFQKTYGGIDRDYLFDLMQTADSGFILAGCYGFDDIALIKTDPHGDTVWTRRYGPSGGMLYAVKQTTDGGYILAGKSLGQAVVIKTDATGYLEWSLAFNFNLGRTNDVFQADDGGYVIAGSYNDNNYTAIFIAKTDSSGNLLWIKSPTNTFFNKNVSCIRPTNDGGYILAGTYGSPNYNDLLLIKTDSVGDFLWSKVYYEGLTDLAATMAIPTADGGYIVSGASGSQGLCVFKTDSTGTIQWSKAYDGDVAPDPGRKATAISKCNDGTYVLTVQSNGLWSLVVVRIDSVGTLLSEKTYGGPPPYFKFFSGAAQQTFDGGYIVGGMANKTTSSYDYDMYLVKTDSLGVTICSNGGPGFPASSYSLSMNTMSLTTQIPTVTVSTPPLTLKGGVTVYNLCGPAGIADASTPQNGISISPNPTSGRFVIQLNTKLVNAKVEIFNVVSERVFEDLLFNETEKEFNLQPVSPGIYFVKVSDGEKSYCAKLVVEGE